MKNYMVLRIIALIAMVQITSAIEKIKTNNSTKFSLGHNNNFEDNQHHQQRVQRQLGNIIDGMMHYISSAGVLYYQRLNNNKCFVEYSGQLLPESSVAKIGKKLYRVENCLLERAFHICGPNLLLMIEVVCRAIEPTQTTTITKSANNKNIPQTNFLRRVFPRDIHMSRVITESCCENLCTITELTRYCRR